jgi:hypothetical protein
MKAFVAPCPEVGDVRIVRKFLLFPRRFKRDWRWLEFADIKEVFSAGGMCEPCFWSEKDFADNRSDCLESVEKKQISQTQETNEKS